MASSRKTGVVVVNRQSVAGIHDALAELASNEVLVGFPEDTTERDEEDTSLTNASLAYIHDTGMPEQNIPARPFMIPGVEQGLPKAAEALKSTARAVLTSKSREVASAGLHRVGLIVQAAIRGKINEGVPPPLAKSTLQERARRGRKGAKQELELRARGEAPSVQFAKPLIDTGQMRNAVNYVIRKRPKRRRL